MLYEGASGCEGVVAGEQDTCESVDEVGGAGNLLGGRLRG